jgi:DnaJ family protein A protein 2
MGRDFYKILEISKNASDKEIKKSYRKLALKYHPDKCNGKDEKFKEINEVYSVLSDPEKRKTYDRFGEDGLNGNIDRHDPHDIFNSFFNRQSPFGGINFNFGGGERNREKEKPIHKLNLTLEQVFKGSNFSAEVPKYKKCNLCEGRGIKTTVIQLGPGMIQRSSTTCSNCKGNGWSKHGVEKILFSTKKGIRENSIITVNNHRFKVTIKNHKIFKRNGNDLIMEKEINLLEALIGGYIEFTHLDGSHKREWINGIISPENNKVILRNLGLKSKNHNGNLIIIFKIKFPYKIANAKALVDGLRTKK